MTLEAYIYFGVCQSIVCIKHKILLFTHVHDMGNIVVVPYYYYHEGRAAVCGKMYGARISFRIFFLYILGRKIMFADKINNMSGNLFVAIKMCMQTADHI